MRSSTILAAAASAFALAGVAAVTAGGSSTDTTIRLYEHDTSTTNLDLGDAGDSPGDQFVFAGDTFARKGGPKIGRLAGTMTTASAGPTAELVTVATFSLPGGQIASEGVFVASELFAGKLLTFAITGGTGSYRHARGEGSIRIPPSQPTDAAFVLRLR
jgi:hypothetical protein